MLHSPLGVKVDAVNEMKEKHMNMFLKWSALKKLHCQMEAYKYPVLFLIKLQEMCSSFSTKKKQVLYT